MQYYNIHSHVFTMNNAPKNFLELYMPKLAARAVDTLTNTRAGTLTVAKFLSFLGEGTKRYASFLNIGKSNNQVDVFEQMYANYKPSDPNFKLSALTMYMDQMGADSSISGFEGQLEGVMDIKRKYPDNLLVFLGIDPRWKGTGHDLRLWVESKFDSRMDVGGGRSVFPYVGLKIYPSTGFYAFDERLNETFEWAADNGVPIISHCNYMGGIYNNSKDYLVNNQKVYDPYSQKVYEGPKYQQDSNLVRSLLGTNTSHNNQLSCSYFLEPNSYKAIFKYFNSNRQLSIKKTGSYFDAYRNSLDLTGKLRMPLKIDLAHYGGSSQVLMQLQGNGEIPVGVNPMNWCGQIRELMTQFEGVYTDVSYTLSNPQTHKLILQDLNSEQFGERIMFGTDFFLTEREMPEKKDYESFRIEAQAQSRTSVPNCNAWDLIASKNPETFLHSTYYDKKII